MHFVMKKNIFFLFLFGILFSSAFAQQVPATEIRAVWLTTNYDLDWPRSKSGVQAQKQELIRILDDLKALNFNVVLFQARNSGEVLYKSKIEPMYSSIAQGYGSETFDPLAFVVEECHKRAMQCHAWLITYPLGSRKHQAKLGVNSTVSKNRDIVTLYKGAWFLDPGNPKTDDYLLSIVREIVNNYQVDGIHFDYIRYPDRAKDFNDNYTYRRYANGKDVEEWRRDNITRFVTKIYDWVKSAKPWVAVSSSPLGRYKPTYSNPNDGWTAYYSVYQDAVQWVKNGKQDMLFPMMYYKGGYFYPYVDDWMKQRSDRFVAPGLGIYQIQELGWMSNEIIQQLDYSRKQGVAGNAFFRTEHLLKYNQGVVRQLKEKYYKYPAKMPAMTWLSKEQPAPPVDITAEKSASDFQLHWKTENLSQSPVTYNVYRSETDSVDITDGAKLIAANIREPFFAYNPPEDDKAYYYFITVSDGFHNESKLSIPAFFWHSKITK